ncbi:MAG: hypothetical protein IPJ48_20165 [Propionivibrio sp.]|uniref:Uncharacterized protein n=1 Tax=Candidatus Propionivibrio dominans TaxID=2954373 RepID=A0A9D7FAI1_9RHOO|nr:hypothetical protein [Candidatus Propionivibrio dominans]
MKNRYFLISMLVTPAHPRSVSFGAQAGVQLVYLINFMDIRGGYWIPACAGMTAWKMFNH